MKKTKKTFFLTGATGLIGSYLLYLLLREDHQVYALSRKKNSIIPSKRIHEALRFWNNSRKFQHKIKNNLNIIEGDIEKKKLGLSSDPLKHLCNEVDEIIHCASLTKFNADPNELKAINVEGTRQILDLGIKWYKTGRLKKINYLSTVYICGDFRGRFIESDLDLNQKFGSAYLLSKFEAEKTVEQYRKKGLWIDNFRPCIVVGEKNFGKIPHFQQAFYQALKIWNAKIFEYFPFVDNFPFYLVFVDDLCESIYCILSYTKTKNKNYHPFCDKFFSLGKLLRITNKFFCLTEPKRVLYEDFIRVNTPAQRKLAKHNFLFLNKNVKLDSHETNKLLEKFNFKFVVPNKKNINILLKYATANNFLQKKSEN